MIRKLVSKKWYDRPISSSPVRIRYYHSVSVVIHLFESTSMIHSTSNLQSLQSLNWSLTMVVAFMWEIYYCFPRPRPKKLKMRLEIVLRLIHVSRLLVPGVRSSMFAAIFIPRYCYSKAACHTARLRARINCNSSVCPSVCNVEVRGHISWVSTKVIKRIIWSSKIGNLVQWEQPQNLGGIRVGSLFIAENLQYL